MDLKDIGKIIEYKRKEMGLTQTQLGAMVDVSLYTISRIEGGINHINLLTFAKIGIILGLNNVKAWLDEGRN